MNLHVFIVRIKPKKKEKQTKLEYLKYLEKHDNVSAGSNPARRN